MQPGPSYAPAVGAPALPALISPGGMMAPQGSFVAPAMQPPAMHQPPMHQQAMPPAVRQPPMQQQAMPPAMHQPPMHQPPMQQQAMPPAMPPAMHQPPTHQPPMHQPRAPAPFLPTGTMDHSGGPQPIPMVDGNSPILIGFLVTFQNDPAGKFWPLRSGRVTLGRSGAEPAADIAIADASASGRHAVIVADPATGQAFIADTGSRNGTFINEQKLAPNVQRQLADDDRIRFGSMTLVVKLLAS